MQTDAAARAIGGDPFAPFDETVTFGLGVHRWANAPEGLTIEDNPFVDYVSDKLNVELEVLWEVDPGGFEDKISLAMVSGDLPDAFTVSEQILLSLVESDLITDLTEYYDKLVSPYIKEIHASYGDRLLDTVMFDGRMMAIPGTNLGGAQQMLWIRMDWLDKLGLEVPETLDEVIDVARAFVENDPDGNGVDDTVGFTIEPKVAMRYNSIHGLDPVFAVFGALPRLWIRDDAGDIVYGTITPETKEALRFVTQMYQEGLIDKEFVTRVGSSCPGIPDLDRCRQQRVLECPYGARDGSRIGRRQLGNDHTREAIGGLSVPICGLYWEINTHLSCRSFRETGNR